MHCNPPPIVSIEDLSNSEFPFQKMEAGIKTTVTIQNHCKSL